MSTMLKVLIDNDWLDHDFIDNYTSGWEETAKTVEHCTLEWGEKITGVPKELIYKAAEMWGKAKTSFLVHARGIEQHRKGVLNVLSCINLVLATGRIGVFLNRNYHVKDSVLTKLLMLSTKEKLKGYFLSASTLLSLYLITNT